MAQTERIVVTEDGRSLPVIEILTGRGVIFGKSGSGKSNSASVVVEELLEKGFPVLIVDIEGEYATLTDRYDVVHVGDSDEFDYELFDIDPGRIVDFCLDQNRPVVIDLSDVLDIERAHSVIADTLTVLFSREKRVQQPFLVIVEEVHEFLPQQGGLDDLGETLIRIAKRGRKRGLGLMGMSQRPAAVDKDFITQCDWIVWHRLTWENDTRVVKSILGTERAQEVQELETGAAIMMTDWDDTIRRVKFRRKRTADAGDTPTLSPEERRDLTMTSSSSPASSTSAASSSSTSSSSSSSPSASSPAGFSAASSSSDGTGSSSPSDAESSPSSPSSPDEMDERATRTEASTSTERPAPTDGESRETNGDVLVEPYPAERQELDQVTDGNRSRVRSSAPEFAPPPKEATPVPDADGDESSVESAETTGQPVEALLWELGQLVMYILTSLVRATTALVRTVVSLFGGTGEPADRLGRVSSNPDPSIRAVWIVVGLLVLLVSLLLVAVALV
ncbi:MAG: ATP-binding protein [Halodesulfurarchaeum sp.]